MNPANVDTLPGLNKEALMIQMRGTFPENPSYPLPIDMPLYETPKIVEILACHGVVIKGLPSTWEHASCFINRVKPEKIKCSAEGAHNVNGLMKRKKGSTLTNEGM